MHKTKNNLIEELSQVVESQGALEGVTILPDGSGFAVCSFPLPKNHWLTANPDDFNVPPMPLRIGTSRPGTRAILVEMLNAVGRYAVRCATENGKIIDFDPDALIQNLIVGMLGYWTADGLSEDLWANPLPFREDDWEYNQQRLVEIDLLKPLVTAYYDELERTLANLAAEVGVDGYFQAADGTVYKIVKPEGTFVSFKDVGFVRTRREGEAKGTLSMKEAQEAGYDITLATTAKK